MPEERSPLRYAEAGVDIAAGADLVNRIAPAAARTRRPGTMAGLGGFGALFDPAAAGYADPVLVAATDGVGTKLRVGIETGRLGGLGQDLVAMCVNDLVCQGAEPLFFLDYFATGALDGARAARVIEGVAAACAAAKCALIGGETAEMPGLYAPGDFDLAGFAVGAAPRGGLLPRQARPGDVLLGLPSSGVHSNGFSLIRRIAEREGAAWDDRFAEGTLGEALMRPTRLYVPDLLPAIRAGHIVALAHITGGGLTENVPRALPEGLGARIDLSAWRLPPIFAWASEGGALDRGELLRTFNAGIGMVAVVRPDDAGAVARALPEYAPIEIGTVVEGAGVAYVGDWM